jgi:hypothetical protein
MNCIPDVICKRCVMGSSQKYWQYARDCARWERDRKEEDDQEILQRMAKAWINVALADEDVAREALYEPKGRLNS